MAVHRLADVCAAVSVGHVVVVVIHIIINRLICVAVAVGVVVAIAIFGCIDRWWWWRWVVCGWW